MSPRKCHVDGCENEDRGNTPSGRVCRTHYQRWKKYGTFTLPDRRLSWNGLCTVDGCVFPVRNPNGAHCETHYYRLRRGSSKGLAPIALECERCETALIRNQSKYCVPCATIVNYEQRLAAPSFHENAKRYAHERRARQLGAGYEKFNGREILERDGWRCQICMRKIDKRIKHPHPFSGTVDHIVPLARGGDHSKRNCQAAHFRCNQQKSTASIGQLRLFG